VWVVSFTPWPLYPQRKRLRYPLDRRLGGPQRRAGHGVDEKNFQPPPGIELRSSDRLARSQPLYRLSYGSLDIDTAYEIAVGVNYNCHRAVPSDISGSLALREASRLLSQSAQCMACFAVTCFMQPSSLRPLRVPALCLRAHLHISYSSASYNPRLRGCIQKFPDWPPGARELQIVQLSATRCSCIAILWVSLVSFAAITLCVASQRVFIVMRVYFVIDSVRKILDTHSYHCLHHYILLLLLLLLLIFLFPFW
jgi:hypothetical protein